MKRYSQLPLNDHMNACIELLQSGQKLFENDASLKSLEGVANIRYVLMIVAGLLHREARKANAMIPAASNGNKSDDDRSNGNKSDDDESDGNKSDNNGSNGNKSDDESNGNKLDNDELMNFTEQQDQQVVEAQNLTDASKQKLLKNVQSFCKSSSVVGPSHYLLKLVVRQFGFSFLKELVRIHSWVIPKDISWSEEVCEL